MRWAWYLHRVFERATPQGERHEATELGDRERPESIHHR